MIRHVEHTRYSYMLYVYMTDYKQELIMEERRVSTLYRVVINDCVKSKGFLPT